MVLTVLPFRPPELQEGFLVAKVKFSENGPEEEVVRLLVSFDMGWSQRSTGFKYDSYNGFCAIIGYKTGKVLDFCTKNRKCRTCAESRKLKIEKPHDCRLNHLGTAKSMEAEGAVQLVTRSEILKNAKTQVGVFIGDNDATCMSALEEVLDYKIVKQSDINHSKKGVGNYLYKMRADKTIDVEKELGHDTISYIKDSFATIIKKHVNDKENIEKHLRNLPYHVFDQHDQCGSFCGYKKDKETYDNSRHLKNPTLFEHMKKFFSSLADSSSKFVLSGSSQANESLNNTMASYFPKAMSYSTSESGDYRFACAVAHKNIGDSFILKVLERLSIFFQKQLRKFFEARSKKAVKRLARERTPAVKAIRKYNAIRKQQLRNQKEKNSTDTYSSNISLLEVPTNAENLISEVSCDLSYNTNNFAIVFFDLETGGFKMDKDILQIAMKSENSILSTYLSPIKPIDTFASAMTGLTKNGRQLFLNGNPVVSISRKIAVLKVLEYFQKFGKKVVLVAHNCKFDAPRFLRLIKLVSTFETFESVISGFVDTLPLFKKIIPNRKSYKLTNLTEDLLQVSIEDAHNAIFDVEILEKLTLQYIPIDDLLKNQKTCQYFIEQEKNKANIPAVQHTLKPMTDVLTKILVEKFSKNGIDFNYIIDNFFLHDYEKLESFLTGKNSKEITYVSKKNSVLKISEYLNSLKNILEK